MLKVNFEVMANHNYRKLEIYRRSKTLAVDILKRTKGKKPFRVFEQIMASALSVPSNIAEGATRLGQKEFIRFLNYSQGSASELLTQLEIILEAECIQHEFGKKLLDEALELEQMLESFIRVQRNQLTKPLLLIIPSSIYTNPFKKPNKSKKSNQSKKVYLVEQV